MTIDALCEAAWGDNPFGYENSLMAHIRCFVGIITLSAILLVILNATFFAVVFVKNTSTFSPWDMADRTAAALQLTDNGYSISDDARLYKWVPHFYGRSPKRIIGSRLSKRQNLSNGSPVCVEEKGMLSELAEKINQTSEILQMQARQLRKKETARANWIAGVSHDVRTPLTMKKENAISIVRQVIADFMNMNIDDKFPIEWKTADTLSDCCINADRDLLKRAISNLIQNSINHNENGCAIYASVVDDNDTCRICIEDDGTG